MPDKMLFNIIFVKLIIQIYIVSSDKTSENLWINLISKEITITVEPYQLTIFIDYYESCYLPQYNALIQKFQYKPNIIIDYKHTLMSGNNQVLNLSIFNNLRQPTIYLILLNQLNGQHNLLADMKQHLKCLVQIEPLSQRPNFLIVIFKNDLLSCDILRPILNYSWSYKFLDFSTIQLNLYRGDITDQYLFYYNPFYKCM